MYHLFSRLLGAVLLCCFCAHTQDLADGRSQYENLCARCHGGDGNGGELGPGIVRRAARLEDAEIATLLKSGLPARGMPAFQIDARLQANLIAFLRTLSVRRKPAAVIRKTIDLTDGRRVEGIVLNQSATDLQLRDDAGKIYLLRPSGARYRAVTSDSDWPTYNGDPRGNRYSTLAQIEKNNVGRLAPKWMFTLQDAPLVETTPVVAGGVMYVTSANECYALDAGSGRQLWHFERPRTHKLNGDAAAGMNRGVAIGGTRLFMVTDNAHIIALSRATGDLLWETEMADWHVNYNATSAPLAVGNLVISGTAGGDEGARGFLAAFDQETGKEVWRFWTAPKAGEPLAETWNGAEINHPGAMTWFTGTYDPQTGTLYWPTGNPGNDLNGDARAGDNLYSCSILALDVRTGKLKWYFQFTPHDVWDWDATEPPVLLDTEWQGRPRKLLVQANRNGFFYVLDRSDGKLLLATPFVRNLTWARGIGEDGRPLRNPGQEPSTAGTKVCPTIEGASNWFSTSFNPLTGFYYVQTLEACGIYTKRGEEWKAGRGYMGGTTADVAGMTKQKILRALDIQTGKAVWEVPETGEGDTWGGVLSTATGLVFVCEDSGAFAALDARTGQRLWQFQTSQHWKASPMAYSFDGEERIAVAAGQSIIAFGLVSDMK